VYFMAIAIIIYFSKVKKNDGYRHEVHYWIPARGARE
jgi:hypothetical protein